MAPGRGLSLPSFFVLQSAPVPLLLGTADAVLHQDTSQAISGLMALQTRVEKRSTLNIMEHSIVQSPDKGMEQEGRFDGRFEAGDSRRRRRSDFSGGNKNHRQCTGCNPTMLATFSEPSSHVGIPGVGTDLDAGSANYRGEPGRIIVDNVLSTGSAALSGAVGAVFSTAGYPVEAARFVRSRIFELVGWSTPSLDITPQTVAADRITRAYQQDLPDGELIRFGASRMAGSMLSSAGVLSSLRIPGKTLKDFTSHNRSITDALHEIQDAFSSCTGFPKQGLSLLGIFQRYTPSPINDRHVGKIGSTNVVINFALLSVDNTSVTPQRALYILQGMLSMPESELMTGPLGSILNGAQISTQKSRRVTADNKEQPRYGATLAVPIGFLAVFTAVVICLLVSTV
eukprot:TRINITY_DN49101_c0_g1_i1.p1 TRINITY_DN49101_c0_g1~~TRINITY_DN49101_c0_g1_i1.p1  ORF type:complete len:399 (+),score=38.65 TRINITY_DN49101_c0_g1_i1:97-1293(+)